MSQLPNIETPRLFLTWPNRSQIHQYYHDIIGTDIFDTLLWDGPSGVEDLENYWKECRLIDSHDFSLPLGLAIIHKETLEFIGGISLRPVNKDCQFIDIGYALAKKFHGKGYGSEAVGALVDHAFEAREAQRIFATVFTFNPASKRVLEKVGFKYEGTLRHCVKKQGVWSDEWLFAITRPDWTEASSLDTV